MGSVGRQAAFCDGLNKYEFKFLFLLISKRFNMSCPEEYLVLQHVGCKKRRVKNYVMRKLVFRGPNCVFICHVELKVAVLCRLCCTCISPHTSFADGYCIVLVRDISSFSCGVLKVPDCLTA